MLESTMDGQPYQAGHHAATLRRQIWREHLGLIEAQPLDADKDPNAKPPTDCPNDIGEGPEFEEVADPLGDKLWEKWTSQATKNTEVYRYLFRADPDNHSKFASMLLRLKALTDGSLIVTNFDEYDGFAPRKQIKQGHLHDPFMPVAEIRKKLDEIRGHLVWMPLDFLKDAEMAEKGMQVNAYTEVRQRLVETVI